MTTEYHSQYWANALTVQGSFDDVHALSQTIATARVDLNPHQVDAALFAIRSPLSHGVVLADEVGLGKTIEAGIVIAQRWAERRRKILLIVPASLRKQWQEEMASKFGLRSVVMDAKLFRGEQASGRANPLERSNELLICSYHFAVGKAEWVAAIDWDLVVIDEAHRLRNVYKTSSKMAKTIAQVTEGTQKLLLTATPFQNRLMELYGLISIIDPNLFGDPESFRDRYDGAAADDPNRLEELRGRIGAICTRTLRRQVGAYIKFTRRLSLTQEFFPTDEEQRLYDLVSAYLARETLAALPNAQRALVTLILRKLLASSTFAIAGTLRKMLMRLETEAAMVDADAQPEPDLMASDLEDFEVLEELSDEWNEEEDEATDDARAAGWPSGRKSSAADLSEELKELHAFARLAESIDVNAKGTALLSALAAALDNAEALGAERKAVIFTESRRTQQYLFDLLSANGYAGQLVIINGTNTDEESRKIYDAWRERNQGTSLSSGSRTADLKAAIIEEFRERRAILLATEAAAEGVNLQFCSLVVNYDLPWNPQRVEQRIGRCHRYGQRHDVVVVNFVNKRNAADQRVFELLSEKFQLFDGVFGASDTILGVISSGVDIERRIAKIYQECRTESQIDRGFADLRAELDGEIAATMETTRQRVLEDLDEEVHRRLEVHRDQALQALTQREEWLHSLTRFELQGQASFDDLKPRFRYEGDLAPPGHFNFDWRDAERRGDEFYHSESALAQVLIHRALKRSLGMAAIELDLASHGAKVAALEPLRGSSGWLSVARLTISSLRDESSLIVAGITDDGAELEPDVAAKFFHLRGAVCEEPLLLGPAERLNAHVERITAQLVATAKIRGDQYFNQEVTKLENWAEDLGMGLERELKAVNKAISDARRVAKSKETNLSLKLEAQRSLRKLESKRAKMRKELFQAHDDIEARRNRMIDEIERQLQLRAVRTDIFSVRWTIS